MADCSFTSPFRTLASALLLDYSLLSDIQKMSFLLSSSKVPALSLQWHQLLNLEKSYLVQAGVPLSTPYGDVN